MPGKRRIRRPVSQAQARLFGAVAGGVATEAEGLTPEDARDKLRGVKVRNLPKRKRRKTIHMDHDDMMVSHGKPKRKSRPKKRKDDGHSPLWGVIT